MTTNECYVGAHERCEESMFDDRDPESDVCGCFCHGGRQEADLPTDWDEAEVAALSLPAVESAGAEKS